MFNWRKSTIARKSKQVVARLTRPRLAARATPDDYRCMPPVLCNSFPKSGTHLLAQVLEALPGVVDRHAFWACMPSLTFRERSPAVMLKMVDCIVPGELVCAHLHHDAACAASLANHNTAHYLIYRDLRDVAVSEAHYLAGANRWHRMHKTFASLPDAAAQLSLAITGVTDKSFAYDYPDIGKRFARFRGWLQDENVMPVRFEDLISDQREVTLKSIIEFYLQRCAVTSADVDEIIAKTLDNIDPARSYTFRQGKSGGWRDVFTDQHKSQMKSAAGELLIELGYEADLEW